MTRADFLRRVRARRTAVLLAFDASMICVAYVVATTIRYDFTISHGVGIHLVVTIGCALLLQCVLGLVGGVYRGRVGVASFEETIHLGLATMAGGFLIFLINALVYPPWIARSVPPSATTLGLILMFIGRALWRQHSDRASFHRPEDGRTAVVVGAGHSGTRLVRSMLTHPEFGLVPAAYLDDDPWKQNRRDYGVPVMGRLSDLEVVVSRTGADVVVVAIPSATKELLRPLADLAREIGVELKVLPSVAESPTNQIDVRGIRDVNLLDILGRAAIETDIDSIAGYVTGKRVLITGAGGSIGSELCRQLYRYGPSELIMLDRDESALHAVQLSLIGRALLDSTDVVLNDIRDLPALRMVFRDRGPEVVFHAAALKHLPMLEQYPHEAMKTNVLGTANVLQAAREVGVGTFVNVSTDKAADPTSVLGYSKRIAERLTAAVAHEAVGSYLSVRFGNVLGSRGSVLHTFTSQISSGGPVTVTHPEITRYFMTVEEAVQLVIQAGAIGESGDVMILDMGEPVKILDVAHQLIAMSGKDIDVVFTGLRGGEKLHEQLFGGRENDARSEHPLISHASVSPLTPEAVRAFDIDVGHLGLRLAFQDWARSADAAVVADKSGYPAYVTP